MWQHPERHGDGDAVLNRLDRLTPETLSRLNHGSLDKPVAIRALLARLYAERTLLRNGINGRNEPITARIEQVGDTRVCLRVENFDRAKR